MFSASAGEARIGEKEVSAWTYSPSIFSLPYPFSLRYFCGVSSRAMGVSRYGWSVVVMVMLRAIEYSMALVMLSETMSRPTVRTVRYWRPARNDSTDGLARSENGSGFQSTMVNGKKEYL